MTDKEFVWIFVKTLKDYCEVQMKVVHYCLRMEER